MQNLIVMTNNEARKYEIINRLINKKINGTVAAKQLSLSVRQTKRLKASVKQYGIKGIIHGNRNKESKKKIPKKLKDNIIKLIKENYSDFTPALVQEKLDEIHDIKISYGSTRNIMIEEKIYLVKSRKINKKYFSQRLRKEYVGELIQFDGSYHNWLEGRDKKDEQCLLLAVDDATGKIVHAKLDKNEGIEAVFSFWKEYMEETGKPIAIYLDKFSTYKINHKNAVDNQDLITQFQRVMNELGIKVIFANSPQAKGRVERMNGTLQDRLIKDMRLAKINNIKDANKFIKEYFTPKFNQKFSITPKKKENLHKKLLKQENNKLNNIFSVKETRAVRNDFVLQYKNRYFQLAEIQPITVYKKDKVIIEKHLNNTIHINKKDKYLNFIELKEKPTKEIDIKLPAITLTKSYYKPPINHPWRNFNINNRSILSKNLNKI